MKPLSTINFLRGSLGKALPLALTTCLAVALLCFLTVLMSLLAGQIGEIAASSLTNVAVIGANEAGLSAGDMDALRANRDILAVYPCGVRGVDYNVALGSPTTTYLFLLRPEDLQGALEAQGLALAEGSLPQKPFEVALNRKLAENSGLAVGSVVTKGTFGWRVERDVTITGILDGPAVVGVGLCDEATAQGPGSSLLLTSGGAGFDGMNGFVEQTFGRRYQVFTRAMAVAAAGKVTKVYTAISVFTGILLVVVLGFLLGNISMIQYEQRRKEFQLLSAIGYTGKNLSGKVFREVASAGVLGWAAGILLAALAACLTNVMILSPKGMAMAAFDPAVMAAMLLVPAFITLFGMAAPLKMLKLKDI